MAHLRPRSSLAYVVGVACLVIVPGSVAAESGSPPPQSHSGATSNDGSDRAVSDSARKAGHSIKNAAEDTGEVLKNAGKKTGKELEGFGHKVSRFFKNLFN